MQRALLELSTFFDPDPKVICHRILEVLSDLYNGTMAMINLCIGEEQVIRDVVNTHPSLVGVSRFSLPETF
ncbi:MAG: hypothetical protein HY248_04505 [Fimbriimonas ginsengisoli]|nr:hypothetical protein [Fimbriimonas ginsengisoli]